MTRRIASLKKYFFTASLKSTKKSYIYGNKQIRHYCGKVHSCIKTLKLMLLMYTKVPKVSYQISPNTLDDRKTCDKLQLFPKNSTDSHFSFYVFPSTFFQRAASPSRQTQNIVYRSESTLNCLVVNKRGPERLRLSRFDCATVHLHKKWQQPLKRNLLAYLTFLTAIAPR